MKDERELVAEAIAAGRVTIDPAIAGAVSRMDLTNPDFTITSVKITGWKPWRKTAKDGATELGNDGGFSVDWETVSAGCGRASFYYDLDGRLRCGNEAMGREFLKSLLAAVVDAATLEDDR